MNTGRATVNLSATKPAGTEGPLEEPRTWHNLFIWAVVAGLGLAVEGCYILPDFPALYPYLAGWLVALLIAIWIFVPVVTRLWRSTRGAGYDDYQKKKKSEHLNFAFGLLVAAGAGVTQALIGLFINTARSSWWETIVVPLSSLAAAFICAVLFALVWHRPAIRSVRLLNKGLGYVLGILVYMGLYSLLYLGAREISTAKLTRPAATWSTQLSVAQREATKIDGDAVLTDVSATHALLAGIPQSMEGPLKVKFTFVTPDGSYIGVEFLDSNPEATVSAGHSPYGRGEKPTKEQPAELRAAVETVRIGPRQALDKTVEQARAFAKEGNETYTNPIISLQFRASPLPRRVPVPGDQRALWKVMHFTTVEGVREQDYWVDPGTGEIVEKQSYNSSTPTPTPSAGP